MDIYTATEVAYKNGYEKGKQEAVIKFVAELLDYQFYAKNLDYVVMVDDIIKAAKQYGYDMFDILPNKKEEVE